VALLRKLQAIPELANYRLVGGTALALRLGHRKSISDKVLDYSKPQL
jgi:hypothetical protein